MTVSCTWLNTEESLRGNWPHLTLNANSAERESKWPKAVAAAAATAADRVQYFNTGLFQNFTSCDPQLFTLQSFAITETDRNFVSATLPLLGSQVLCTVSKQLG